MIKTHRHSSHKHSIHSTKQTYEKGRTSGKTWRVTNDDQECINICLNCEREKCTGRCERMKRSK